MRAQRGAIRASQLTASGMSRRRVQRLVADGSLIRWHQGVFVDGCAPMTARTHLWAAQLALGPNSFLSHRSAAALMGLRPINVRAIELTVARGHTPRIKGLTVHRTTHPPDRRELRTTDGLRHSSFTRVLIELAPHETDQELDRLVTEGARRNLFDLARIDAALKRRQRVPGRARLEQALARHRPTPRDASGFERDFAAWLTTLPDIPPPQRNVHYENRWELDFFWPQQRLVVETDGDRYHRLPQDLERDRLKDAWLQRRGIRVIRITEFRFAHDRAGIHADLLALLARAA